MAAELLAAELLAAVPAAAHPVHVAGRPKGGHPTAVNRAGLRPARGGVAGWVGGPVVGCSGVGRSGCGGAGWLAASACDENQVAGPAAGRV
ncbi:hypothetical protein [Fodinicola feengrottensis]|uniref:hypothetical protein n=1 Tax=Fodinicola feengrottensis TaxID=435914 RepID=UPI0024413B07|nr:hypothetical protein [Fodinicola feengrottensis]